MQLFEQLSFVLTVGVPKIDRFFPGKTSSHTVYMYTYMDSNDTYALFGPSNDSSTV